jgi:hypothetical protein
MNGKLTLALAAIVFVTQASANAADCKFEKNELDKFTKVKIVQTEWDRLTTGPKFFSPFAVYTSIRVKDDKTFLGIKLAMTEHDKYRPRAYQLNNRFTIAEGAELLLLMADGSIVELRTPTGMKINATYQDPKNMEYIEDFQIESAGALEYALDEATIAALAAQEVTHLRIAGLTRYGNPYNTYFDVWVREKMMGSIRKAVNCAK